MEVQKAISATIQNLTHVHELSSNNDQYYYPQKIDISF